MITIYEGLNVHVSLNILHLVLFVPYVHNVYTTTITYDYLRLFTIF